MFCIPPLLLLQFNNTYTYRTEILLEVRYLSICADCLCLGIKYVGASQELGTSPVLRSGNTRYWLAGISEDRGKPRVHLDSAAFLFSCPFGHCYFVIGNNFTVKPVSLYALHIIMFRQNNYVPMLGVATVRR